MILNNVLPLNIEQNFGDREYPLFTGSTVL